MQIVRFHDKVQIIESGFKANKMTLCQIQQITNFPQARRLQIVKSTINLFQTNEIIQRLQTVNSKIQNFSLKQITLLNVQFSKYNDELNKFIQNKNKLLKLNRKNEHRIQDQKWKKKMNETKRDFALETINQILRIIKLDQQVKE
ncbi:Hypothetical_protein [Hexamita inflata]|uniref:Hypothetical_protein n=1 Tax=Hexamita inflata TaxID=28002 RepID=A0AA86NJ40_9EUKA|nr:Hypothetical protein HINF_LOCUS7628 [Hexamita inflata]